MGRSASKLSAEEVTDLQKATHFDKKTLNLWNRGFTKESPSGTLTLPEFTRLYRQYFPFGDPGPFAEHVFRALDTDKNGAIDFREFIVSLNATTRAAADEKLSFCFRLYDVTGDGWITRNEMLLVVDSIYRMVGNVVAAQLPEDEQSPEARVDKLFAVFDTRKAGRISPEEFRAGAKRDPSILHAINIYEGTV